MDIPVNAVKVTEGKLKHYPGLVNMVKINLLWDTGATLVGIHMDLVAEKYYPGDWRKCVEHSVEQRKDTHRHGYM